LADDISAGQRGLELFTRTAGLQRRGTMRAKHCADRSGFAVECARFGSEEAEHPGGAPPTVYSRTDMALRIPQVHDGTGVLRPSALGVEVVGTDDRRAVQGRLQSGAVTEPFPEDVGMVNMPRSCGVGFELAVLGDQ